jgi:hypothetical protein
MAGPPMVKLCGVEFKALAVGMRESEGVLALGLAATRCLHRAMLSRWRSRVREGKWVGKTQNGEPDAAADLTGLREVAKQVNFLPVARHLLKRPPGWLQITVQNLPLWLRHSHSNRCSP